MLKVFCSAPDCAKLLFEGEADLDNNRSAVIAERVTEACCIDSYNFAIKAIESYCATNGNVRLVVIERTTEAGVQ